MCSSGVVKQNKLLTFSLHQIFVGISLPAVYNNGGFSIKTLERALSIKLDARGSKYAAYFYIYCLLSENSSPFRH